MYIVWLMVLFLFIFITLSIPLYECLEDHDMFEDTEINIIMMSFMPLILLYYYPKYLIKEAKTRPAEKLGSEREKIALEKQKKERQEKEKLSTQDSYLALAKNMQNVIQDMLQTDNIRKSYVDILQRVNTQITSIISFIEEQHQQGINTSVVYVHNQLFRQLMTMHLTNFLNVASTLDFTRKNVRVIESLNAGVNLMEKCFKQFLAGIEQEKSDQANNTINVWIDNVQHSLDKHSGN